jgi:hypothetical protein
VLEIRSLGKDAGHVSKSISSIKLLGSNKELAWSHDADKLSITLPATKTGDHAFTFKIEFKAS